MRPYNQNYRKRKCATPYKRMCIFALAFWRLACLKVVVGQYTMRVGIPQCRDARLERPLNQWVKKHNHLSLTSHRTHEPCVPTINYRKCRKRNPLKKKSPLSFAHIKNKHYLCTDIDRVAFLVIW